MLLLEAPAYNKAVFRAYFRAIPLKAAHEVAEKALETQFRTSQGNQRWMIVPNREI